MSLQHCIICHFPSCYPANLFFAHRFCMAANKPTGRGGGEFAHHSVSSGSPILKLPSPPTFTDKGLRALLQLAVCVYFLGKTLFLWPFCLNWLRLLLPAPTSLSFLPACSLPTPRCADVFPEIAWHFWLLSTLSQISIGLRRGSRVIIRAKGRQALTAFQSPLPRASIFPHCG